MIVMGYGGLKFGSLDEMIKVDDLMCLNEGKEAFKEFKVCFERGNDQGGQCLTKGACGSRTEDRRSKAQPIEQDGSPERPTAHENSRFLFSCRFFVGF